MSLGGGEYFRMLVVSPEMYGRDQIDREGDGLQKYGEILRHCPNVTSVSIKESSSDKGNYSVLLGRSDLKSNSKSSK